MRPGRPSCLSDFVVLPAQSGEIGHLSGTNKTAEEGRIFQRLAACSIWRSPGARSHAGGITHYKGHEPLTAAGGIAIAGFTGTIRGASASGVPEDEKICRGTTFTWTASRAP